MRIKTLLVVLILLSSSVYGWFPNSITSQIIKNTENIEGCWEEYECNHLLCTLFFWDRTTITKCRICEDVMVRKINTSVIEQYCVKIANYDEMTSSTFVSVKSQETIINGGNALVTLYINKTIPGYNFLCVNFGGGWESIQIGNISLKHQLNKSSLYYYQNETRCHTEET